MKAVALFSGGLDSILAIKIVEEQKVKVIPLHIYTGFAGRRDKNFIKESVELFGLVEPIIIDVEEEFLEILKNPKFGYGKHLNPCIDCKIFFLRKAKEVMEREEARFIITGEVPGQRPMSQRKDVIQLIEREAQVEGLVVRPLSAKLFPPSIPEKRGWIDRERLYDIHGRGREKQLELAKKYKLKKIPSPAGGCLLTDPTFSRRLKILMDKVEGLSWEEIELLKHGRMFEIQDTIVIVARNEKEAELIKEKAKIIAENSKTTAAIIGDTTGKEKIIAGIILRYSRQKEGWVRINKKKLKAQAIPPEEAHRFLVI